MPVRTWVQTANPSSRPVGSEPLRCCPPYGVVAGKDPSLELGWTTLDELHTLRWMNPYFLDIALTTPLETLLALPNATGLREDLAHLESAQLQALLVCVDEWIK